MFSLEVSQVWLALVCAVECLPGIAVMQMQMRMPMPALTPILRPTIYPPRCRHGASGKLRWCKSQHPGRRLSLRLSLSLRQNTRQSTINDQQRTLHRRVGCSRGTPAGTVGHFCSCRYGMVLYRYAYMVLYRYAYTYGTAATALLIATLTASAQV